MDDPTIPAPARGPLDRAESAVVGALLAAMAVIPLVEIITRLSIQSGLPGAQPVVQHLTLWVAFLGAALAAKDGRLLALATATFLPEGRWRTGAKVLAASAAAAATVLLARAGIELVQVEREFGTESLSLLGVPARWWAAVMLGGATAVFLGALAERRVSVSRLAGIRALGAAGAATLVLAVVPRAAEDGSTVPLWVVQAVLPAAFVLIAWRLLRQIDGWVGRAVVLSGVVLGVVLGNQPALLDGRPVLPGLILIGCAMVAGAPIFTVLGGAAVLLFLADGVPIAAVPVETYRLAVSPTLPAIPLFTLTGFLLAEGKASDRLLGVFRALVGWVPGGTAVVAAVVCAFFTVFTGGSGVTILALGGLLFQGLKADHYGERFSIGLLTASGSLGLLLPPALPLILYGIVAQVPIKDLFLGGLVPGLLLIGLIAGWGVREGLITGAGRTAFAWSSVKTALWQGKWELMLPVFLLLAIFSGVATLVEAAALSALYAFVVQTFVHRELSIAGDLPRVLRECCVLVGGVLIILGVAMGLTGYLVDAQVPAQILAWVKAHIHSPLVFLLALNVFLLLVGCLMDIFSAIVVVVPLIVPLGAAFGIDPIHLGIIFVANLELGYLTPPVGLNLFLASYRFERPLLTVYRAAIPMLVILGIGVLLITYVPWLTTGIFRFF